MVNNYVLNGTTRTSDQFGTEINRLYINGHYSLSYCYQVSINIYKYIYI